jgi:HlyD family secretion protein
MMRRSPGRVFMVAGSLLLLTVGCTRRQDAAWQGYAEADFVNIASSQAGHLDRLLVARGAQTQAGSMLFALDTENESDACDQARAQLQAAQDQLQDMLTGKRPPEIDVLREQLAQARTQAEQSARNRTRDAAQWKSGGVPRQQWENSHSQFIVDDGRVRELTKQIEVAQLPSRSAQIKAQRALVSSYRAALAQAEWRLHQKTVTSPQPALVFDTLYRQGEWVNAGSAVVRLLPPQNIKVRFFVPEQALSSLHIGQNVVLHCDGSQTRTAQISYISAQAEYTPPVIYSNETRAKLVYMIEAHPAPDQATQLHPGQPVEVALR